MIPTAGHSVKGETMYNEKISGCHVWGRREMNKQSTGNFQDSGTIPCDTVMVDLCHYTSVQTHRIRNTKYEL